ncbi:MAG: hypothetical protein AABY22_24820 [Nanoarchaeota archaeon]
METFTKSFVKIKKPQSCFFAKRGAIHVDWALSMGLFLIYVTLLFIIIKPGYYVEHKPEDLFTILNDNFIPNVSTDIKEVQFIITKCSGDRKVTLEDLNDNYEFSKLVKEDGTSLTKGDSVGSKIDIDCRLADPPISKDVFIATSYPKKHYIFGDLNSVPNYKISCSTTGPGTGDCSAGLGVVSDFFGFDKSYLDQLVGNPPFDKTPYGEISTSWGFPLSKSFNITVTNLDKSENPVEVSNHAVVPEGINVFAKEFKWIYLDKFNKRENLRVNIYVW